MEFNSPFHAVDSISIGELVMDGLINWAGDDDAPSMDWSAYAYSPEQYTRVCHMFVQRFWLREVSLYPLKQWAAMVVEMFRELSAKYNPLYEALSQGVNVLQDFDEWSKNRDIFSDFPATQLATENQDYASTANDREGETVHIGDPIDKGVKIMESWKSVDVMMLDEMAPFIFSSLYSVNMNGF